MLRGLTDALNLDHRTKFAIKYTQVNILDFVQGASSLHSHLSIFLPLLASPGLLRGKGSGTQHMRNQETR